MSKKNLIKGVFVDEHGTVKRMTITDSLDSYHKLLNCDTIDIIQRDIHGRHNVHNCTIILDDEGALKRRLITAIDDRMVIQLVGSLFICNTDFNTGDIISLDPSCINDIVDSPIATGLKMIMLRSENK